MKLIILITLLAGSAFAGTVRIKNTPAIEDQNRNKDAVAIQATLADINNNAQTNIEKSVFSNAAEKQEIGDIRAILIDLARENKRLARIVAKLQAEP